MLVLPNNVSTDLSFSVDWLQNQLHAVEAWSPRNGINIIVVMN